MKEHSKNIGEIKLSCRNIWKLFGGKLDSRITTGIKDIKNAESANVYAEELRTNGYIVACCDVSFDVHVGEIFVIMGLSGSGKSTIVRCLSRLVEPTAGEVLLDGEDLLKVSKKELINIRQHRMGMVFQNFGLLPHLNVIDNVAFPLKLQGVSLEKRRDRAQKMISLVDLSGRESSYPRQLSGGQQQRVGIARSLAVEPDLWLLDEPFSALDPLIRRQMQDEFLRIQKVLHKSIVFITHDFQEALRVADRMAIMRDGAIVQVGRPVDLVLHPADDYVSEFTKDVSRAHILTAADVAESGGKISERMQRVSANLSVEELLAHLAEHGEGVVVANEGNMVIGLATAQSVVTALVRDAAGRE